MNRLLLAGAEDVVSQDRGSVRGSPHDAARSVEPARRLRPLAGPDRLLVRGRLHELLDEAAAGPLTLVVAPAGSGKSSLLATWCADLPIPHVQLSVDEEYRDPVQFWSGMIHALEQLAPGTGQQARSLVTRPNSLLDGIAVLLDDLEAAPVTKAVLVVDDVHVVDQDERAVRSLALFLQHLPSWLHVVLAARRAPTLPLDRLRARGQLGEVHFDELRFSHDEAVALLTLLVPTVEDGRLAEIAQHAGGWAAGIQFAALAARASRAQPDLSPPSGNGDLLVEDYVLHEVLRAEDPDLVEVLHDVAVVELAGPALAAALTGRADAGAQLSRAEARGLFVSRLDPSGRYAIHSLVRQVLLAELARRAPERLSRQHARAARWYEDADQIPLALEHWLDAHEPREALRLLAAHVSALYDAGREPTIARTLAAIPTKVVTRDLPTMLEFAWCNLLVDRHRFLGTVDQMRVIAPETADLDPAPRARVTMLRSIAETVRGDWDGGAALAAQALREVRNPWWLDPLGRFSWNMIVRGSCLSESWDDDGEEVRGAREALSVDPERLLCFEGIRALGEALAGRPVDALRVAAGVRTAADVANMTILRSELALAEAIARREIGDLPRAIEELSALAEVPTAATPYCQLLACVELAHARCDVADLSGAEAWFARAREITEREYPGRGARGWVARLGTRLALAGGSLGQARMWSERIGDPFWAGASRARVRLAEGDRAGARSLLDDADPRCVRHRVVRDLLRAQTAPTHDESLKWVVSAIEVGSMNGLMQTIAAEGPEVLQLVEVAAWDVPATWLDRLRRAATAEVGRGRVEALRGTVDQLTDREREVLRYLPSRLTLREIAGELSISMNTLKFHLKVIYRKLQCGSRAEAAEIARSLAQLKRPDQPPSTLRR